ncbi:ribosome biogenesis GTPase YlqF [Motilimonas sp. 1_MG-2023]|uniref:ribosome biogenesis GTPase YlqF n=1 Tax=unclassified Motilimonas TaxID=2643697 RepID=UPI001E45FB70|nr:ribosome biogenesis GTPase YlqF [Motilimonas sp. 1_MG-2023]MCE0557617.1 ribosome biogenesis GTPase YlqF [Motilimonas sp. E26]MDO6526294.1 ribosome biogenesis GTPase YlqF [Motilimonas sp. 1_MG-2023]
MAVHWYPGHMHKAQREIREAMPNVDLIIEVLDARIPYSSENPVITEVRGDKPCIKILNKSDLADPAITQLWLDYYNQQTNMKAVALTTQEPEQVRAILDLCRAMFPERDQGLANIRAMIMGIPNVGKSTTINILAGRIIAKTGNEPAVTKAQQRINLKNGIVLSDTPGILWPKVMNENSSYRLATTGAIKDTAMEYEEVAFFAADYLLKAYPELLKARYQLDELPLSDLELLEAIAAKRGAKRAGGRADLHKVSEILLHEIRSAAIGRVSLETPEMVEKEKVVVAQLTLEREEKQKDKPKKKRRRRN